MEYKTEKSYNGLYIKSQVEINACNHDRYGEGKRILTFTTSKTGTIASVSEHYTQATCSMLCEDYLQTVTRAKVSRATEKALIAAHVTAQPQFAAHIEAAKKQYGVL